MVVELVDPGTITVLPSGNLTIRELVEHERLDGATDPPMLGEQWTVGNININAQE